MIPRSLDAMALLGATFGPVSLEVTEESKNVLTPDRCDLNGLEEEKSECRISDRHVFGVSVF
jgi:hypothetical protein